MMRKYTIAPAPSMKVLKRPVAKLRSALISRKLAMPLLVLVRFIALRCVVLCWLILCRFVCTFCFANRWRSSAYRRSSTSPIFRYSSLSSFKIRSNVYSQYVHLTSRRSRRYVCFDHRIDVCSCSCTTRDSTSRCLAICSTRRTKRCCRSHRVCLFVSVQVSVRDDY